MMISSSQTESIEAYDYYIKGRQLSYSYENFKRDEAIQLYGGMGVSQDTPLAAAWTHLRTLRLADGPDAVHRRQVAKAELKKFNKNDF